MPFRIQPVLFALLLSTPFLTSTVLAGRVMGRRAVGGGANAATTSAISSPTAVAPNATPSWRHRRGSHVGRAAPPSPVVAALGVVKVVSAIMIVIGARASIHRHIITSIHLVATRRGPTAKYSIIENVFLLARMKNMSEALVGDRTRDPTLTKRVLCH